MVQSMQYCKHGGGCNSLVATMLHTLQQCKCNVATVQVQRFTESGAWQGIAHLFTTKCRIPLPFNNKLLADRAFPSDFGSYSSGILWPFGSVSFLRSSLSSFQLNSPIFTKESIIQSASCALIPRRKRCIVSFRASVARDAPGMYWSA